MPRLQSLPGTFSLLLLPMGLFGCSSAEAPEMAPAAHPPALDLVECGPAGNESAMSCGQLVVPEDPTKPRGRPIPLNIIVLPALEDTPSESALFHLEGGPGIAATNGAAFYVEHELGRAFRRDRDVVLVDQRGAGGSNPLRCPGIEDNGPLEDMYRVSEVAACRVELEAQADLTQYGTWHAAGDLERVRQALGYEQIDALAFSYGTKLAQVYMKRFPERVRSAFLVGAIGLDFQTPLFHAVAAQRVLDLLLFRCQSDPACRRAYPNLRDEWQRTLDRLERGPVDATRQDPDTGEEDLVQIRRGPFGHAFRGLLGTAASQRTVPGIIHEMAAGNFAPFVAELAFGPSPFAEGLYLSIACSEGTARIAPEDVGPATAGTFLGDWRVRQQITACDLWPRATLPPGFFEAPTGDIPVIVLGGEMDQPAPYSREMCASLANCRFIFVPHLGHTYWDVEAWSDPDCIDSIALQLYRLADVEAVDASCVQRLEPPPFSIGPRP